MSTDGNNGTHEAIAELTADTYDRTISATGIVLVDCWASWCNACKSFQPVFEETAQRHPAHTFAQLDTQKEEELVASLGIEHIPALMVFRDGLMLFKQPGYFDKDGLDDIIAQAASLDMDEVRAAIEGEKATE